MSNFKNIKIPVNSVSGKMFDYVDNYKNYYIYPSGSHYKYIKGKPHRSEYRSDELFNEAVNEYEVDLKLIESGEIICLLKWIDNEIFHADMNITNVSRGRSSVKFEMIDENSGLQYEMFAKGFLEMIQKANVIKGKVSGNFCYVKRGANYGIEYVGDDE